MMPIFFSTPRVFPIPKPSAIPPKSTLYLSLLLVLFLPLPAFSQFGLLNTNLPSGAVAWADYDNDGDMDLIIANSTSTNIYRNLGNGSFDTPSVGLTITAVENGHIAWGDYDNDGDLDFLLTGDSNPAAGNTNATVTPIATLYRNEGNGTFTTPATGVTLQGIHFSSADWGDYDNDGDLDLIIGGNTSGFGSPNTLIYRNKGDGTFEASGITLSNFNVAAGNLQWGDYDNDGDLDILSTGTTDISSVFPLSATKIFVNNNGSFSALSINIPGVYQPNGTTSFWKDTDNDGDLDLIVTGNAGTDFEPSFISREYINAGGGTFTQNTSFGQNDVTDAADFDRDGKVEFLGTKRLYEIVQNGQVTETDLGLNAQNVFWIDFNNDGRLDICSITSTATRIYRNLAVTPNTIPSIPSNLKAVVKGDSVILSWDAASDTETPTNSLSYNFYIGTTAEGVQTVASMAVNSVGATNFGFRKILKRGNAQLNKTIKIKNLSVDTYYWSVQTIDQSGGSSFFAQEKTFEVKSIPTAPEMLQATRTNGLIDLSWTDKANNEEGFIIQRATTNVDNAFVIIDTINAQSGTNGTATYQEDNSTIQNNTQYFYRVKAYNTGGLSTASNVSNATAIFGIFSPKNATALVNLQNGAADWGDLDNDGDLDFIVTGRNESSSLQTIIYLNNGNGVFVDSQNKTIVGVSDGDIALGDYDGDGDLDILISGAFGTNDITKIYENQGNLSFAELSITTSNVRFSSVAWGDYDNDGDLDAWVTGFLNSGVSGTLSIYRNDGNKQFTEIKTHGIDAIYQGSLDLGDYNNDGHLDALVVGRGSGGKISKVFRNKGDGTFQEANLGITITGVAGNATWGDYDNDGDLDILLIGDPDAGNNGETAKVYKNNGDGTFQVVTTTLFPFSDGNARWIDYDNDGDLDILIAGFSRADGTDRVKLFTNNGGDSFVANTSINIGIEKNGLFLADFDQDQDVDFLHMEGIFSSNTYYTKLIRNETPTPNTLPSIPINLTSQVVKDTVTLQWNKSSDTQTGQNGLSYNIRIGTTPGKGNIVASMSASNGSRRVAKRGFSRNQKLIRNLSPGTYYWSVQALDHSLQGSSFATEGSFKVVSAPVIPTLEAFALSSSTILLFWLEESNDNNASSYVIQRSTGNANNFQNIDTIPSSQGSYEATNLSENTLYYFRVFAYNTAGNGLSNIDFDQTNNLPRSPINLSAVAASSSQINLSWTDVASTETGFIIYRKSLLSNDQFQIIDSLKTINQNSYSDNTGLIGNVTYTYEVRTYNANGVSGEPDEASVTTPIDASVALPPKPLNFFANPFSPSQISLEWTYTSTAANSFVIERSPETDSSNYQQIAEIPAQTLRAYSDTTGLTADRIYYYRIRAKNSGGLSDFSDIALAKAECNLPIFVSLAEGQINQVCIGQGAKIEVTADLFQPTYQWKRNGVKIPSANAQFYVAYQTGEYTCEVSSGSCTQTTKSAVVVVVKDPLTVNISSVDGTLVPSVTNAQTYTWYFNFEPITGANEPNYIPTISGKYHVVIQKDGCSATSNVFDLTTTTGVANNDLSRAIKLSPNPASDRVEFSVESNLYGNYQLWLINTKGQRFKMAQGIKNDQVLKKQLQLTKYPTGTYYLLLELRTQQGVTKLIKHE
ncbi:hypothetical protein BKI52_35050 [marine bacterium AO1-C]|nr:hypothetical protein BKI52_35050 [marine bacterium AO1-C]